VRYEGMRRSRLRERVLDIRAGAKSIYANARRRGGAYT